MLLRLKILLRLYLHSLLVVGLLLTACFCYLIIDGSNSDDVLAILIVRSVLFLPALYLFCVFKAEEFTFYRNLGLSKLSVLVGVMLIDFVISTTILIALYVFAR